MEIKNIILSIEKFNKIEAATHPNITFKQWKYNNDNYIVFVNLERNDEIFEINLLDEYEINIEFGLGSIQKNRTNVTLYLKPIDVIMIKYTNSNNDNSNNNNSNNNNSNNNNDNSKNDNSNFNSKNNTFIIIISIIILIAIIIIIAFFIRRYIIKKEKNDNFINTTSELMDDNE